MVLDISYKETGLGKVMNVRGNLEKDAGGACYLEITLGVNFLNTSPILNPMKLASYSESDKNTPCCTIVTTAFCDNSLLRSDPIIIHPHASLLPRICQGCNFCLIIVFI